MSVSVEVEFLLKNVKILANFDSLGSPNESKKSTEILLPTSSRVQLLGKKIPTTLGHCKRSKQEFSRKSNFRFWQNWILPDELNTNTMNNFQITIN